MLIALLTDFGTGDGFVGAMKGVIQSINPGVQIVDISHEIQPFNVLEGALLLKAHYRYFPKGTVFISVVDPGVGSYRYPIALRLGDYFFVGPDNGIFDLVVQEFEGPPEAVIIENKRMQLPKINNTFHGRDVFAPAGAYISRGVPLEEFGPTLGYVPKLNMPEPKREGNKIRGEIVHFDRFGNAITNVPCGRYSKALFRGNELKVVPYFRACGKNGLCAVCGSFGLMELFVFMESAKGRFELKEGEEVWFLA